MAQSNLTVSVISSPSVQSRRLDRGMERTEMSTAYWVQFLGVIDERMMGLRQAMPDVS